MTVLFSRERADHGDGRSSLPDDRNKLKRTTARTLRAVGIVAGSDLFVFVSHVSEDRPIALEIVAELERRGIRCWITPRDVPPGRPFDDEIAEAIEASRAMLLIFSERCNDNDYIRREVTVAGESHKLIIPFRIEDVPPRRGLRVRLSDLHSIDGFVARERAIEELTQVLAPTSDTEPRQKGGPYSGDIDGGDEIVGQDDEQTPVATWKPRLSTDP